MAATLTAQEVQLPGVTPTWALELTATLTPAPTVAEELTVVWSLLEVAETFGSGGDLAVTYGGAFHTDPPIPAGHVPTDGVYRYYMPLTGYTAGDELHAAVVAEWPPEAGTAYVSITLTGDAAPTDRLRQAALLYALRNAKVMDAPLGVAGGFDTGQVYVGRISSDIGRLLRGYQGRTVPSGQEWPTLADVKARLQATGTVADDFLTECLTSAIDQVHQDLSGSFGIA